MADIRCGKDLPRNTCDSVVDQRSTPDALGVILMYDLPQYIIANQRRIQNLPAQTLPPWSNCYDRYRSDWAVVQRLYTRFPHRLIQRQDIVSLFSGDDLSLALVAALVWGGISTAGITGDNLTKVLQMRESRLQKIMGNTRILVRGDRLREAFNGLETDNKINGVGPAYHTKVLFFFGQIEPRKPNRPLIFDKWTKNAFYALLCQSGEERLARAFYVIDQSTSDTVDTMDVRSSCLVDAYISYVEHMNRWAAQIQLLPDKLEQFVFGEDRRSNRRSDNPRNEILAIVSQFRIGPLAGRS